MPFPEGVRLLVKRRAHFACCLCHEPDVEVHHIVPQADGGSDDSDNAAPLCPSCHSTYGGNPEKRKLIRDARDLWFELCEKRFQPVPTGMDQFMTLLSATATKADLSSAVSAITAALVESPRERTPYDPPVSIPWTPSSIVSYMRWLLPDIRHAGVDSGPRLFALLSEIGYTSVREIHGTVGFMQPIFAQFARDSRTDGRNIDLLTDHYFFAAFFALFDEQYCRRHYPNVAELPGAARLWRRRVDAGGPSAA